VVYAAGHSKLYAFDASSGRTVWALRTDFVIFDSPSVANGLVYIGASSEEGNSLIYALEASSVWTSYAARAGDIPSTPAVANGVLYIGGADRHLYALDASTKRPPNGRPDVNGGENRAAVPTPPAGEMAGPPRRGVTRGRRETCPRFDDLPRKVPDQRDLQIGQAPAGPRLAARRRAAVP
jgi:outer membrane protein assembly factor BamB